MITTTKLFILLTSAIVVIKAAKKQCHSLIPDEKRIIQTNIAIKALVTGLYPDPKNSNSKIAEFWIQDVYKGEDKLAAGLGLPGTGPEAVFHLKDQKVNVSHWNDPNQCWNLLNAQRSYVILLQPNYKGQALFKGRYDDPFGAAIDFTLDTERRLLKALGWSSWSEWSPCSKSCGGGQQERHRECYLPEQPSSSTPKTLGSLLKKSCGSFNAEKRMCNSFKCLDAINTLSVREERYFKPSPSAFIKVAGRGPDAWQIRPGSYFLLPFHQAFGRSIPKDFTFYLTLKPEKDSEGILFSLNARHTRQEYISLELNEGRLELVHSLPNGSKIIDIPAKINDGHWHQLAISIHGGSSVRTYLDCHWITTQVLHRHALKVPKDTDLIVGYMFQGELEQLTVADEASGGVSEQCSPNRMPFQGEDNNSDIHIEEDKTTHKKKGSTHDYLEEEYVDLDWSEEVTTTKMSPTTSKNPSSRKGKGIFDENHPEGSGGHQYVDDEDLHLEGSTEGSGEDGELELEWSSWSQCTATCGKHGIQMRFLRCEDKFLNRGCRHLKEPQKETRACHLPPCHKKINRWIPVQYETVTQTDVDNARHQIRPPILNMSSGEVIHDLKEGKHDPTWSSNAEEHTNVIPHIPNYWTPTQEKNGSSQDCWCANGGTCEYHNHIYGHWQAHGPMASCLCRKGYTGKHCEVALCRPGCANGGQCVDPDVCACPDGFTGARCQTAFCHPGCQNGGSCVAPFKCECPPGVTGAFCQEYSCQPQCANGGVCIGHNLCSCPHGFSGPDCQDKTCTVRCENGGVCTMPNNKCKCRDGFYGTRCHKKICQRYIAVREPHRHSYKKVVDINYDAICEDGKICKKTKQGYQTIYRIVYRTAYKCASDVQ